MATRTVSISKHLPVLEAPEQSRLHTWVQLVRVYNRMIRQVSILLAEQGLTVPQFDLLATLRFSEGVTQQELAERLLVTKGNVSQLLNKLCRLGWVERQPNPDDARANRLRLGSAGRRKIDAVLPRHDALILRSLQGLTAGEITTLRRLLGSFEREIEAE